MIPLTHIKNTRQIEEDPIYNEIVNIFPIKYQYVKFEHFKENGDNGWYIIKDCRELYNIEDMTDDTFKSTDTHYFLPHFKQLVKSNDYYGKFICGSRRGFKDSGSYFFFKTGDIITPMTKDEMYKFIEDNFEQVI